MKTCFHSVRAQTRYQAELYSTYYGVIGLHIAVSVNVVPWGYAEATRGGI